MKSLNKKSMTFNELLGMIITIILFVTIIVYPGSKLYAAFSNQKYADSYNKLVDLIENSEYEEESADLVMRDKSYIAFFSKDSDEITFDYTQLKSSSNPDLGYLTLFKNSIKKPEECGDKSCACFCSDFDEKDDKSFLRLENQPVNKEFLCKNNNCKTFENIDFLNDYDKEGYYLRNFKGGIIVPKNIMPDVQDFGSRTIYIERYGNFIAVCFNKPCINEQQKLELK